MPSRIIREGILTSAKLARLGWAEEVFYRRLMSVVDDFGRYYADAGMLRAACYPRQLNKVSDSDVGKFLRAVADAALVRVYPAEDGERYLQLLKFDQQVRSKKSKFPEPPSGCAADAQHLHSRCLANDHLDVSVSVDVDVDVIEDVDEGVTPARKRARATTPPRPDDVPEQTWADWLQLRKGKHAAVTGTVLSEARNEAGKAGLTLERFLAVWCARGSQGLQADWLRPDERKPINGNHAEPDWRREQRERVQQAAPYAAVRNTGNNPKTVDMEAANALARIPR